MNPNERQTCREIARTILDCHGYQPEPDEENILARYVLHSEEKPAEKVERT